MFMLIRHMMRVPSAAELLPNARGQIQQVSHELSAAMRARPDIAFFNAQGVISFHCAAMFEYQLLRDQRPMVLRMKDVSHIDTTGLITLEGIIEHRHRRGARTILTALQPRVRKALARFGIIRLLGPGNVFENTIDAIMAIEPQPPASPKPEPSVDSGQAETPAGQASTPTAA
jgi:anti-anti-sigma factor